MKAASFFLLFLTPLAFCTALEDAVEAPKLACLLLGVACLSLAWLRGSQPRRGLGLPMRLYLAFTLSWMISALLGFSQAGSDRIVVQACLALMGWSWAVGDELLSVWNLRCLAAAWSCNALYSWMQRFHLDPVGWNNSHLSQERTIGTFGNPDYLAFYLVLLAPLVWSLCHRSWQRVAWSLGMLAMILTTTRASWLSFAVAMPFWVAAVGPARRLLLATLLGLAVLVGVAAAVQRATSDFSIAARLQSGAQGLDESSQTRLMLWEAAVLVGAEKPILGWGPGHYGLEALKHREHEPEATRILQRIPENPHSQYLELWVQCGLVGTFLSLAAWLAAGWRLHAVASQSHLHASLLAAWIILMVNQALVCPSLALQVLSVWLLAVADQQEEGGGVPHRLPPPAMWLVPALLALLLSFSVLTTERLYWEGDDVGLPAVAEQKYQTALALNPPWKRGSSLTRLARTAAQPQQVEYYRRQALDWQPENPYYWALWAAVLEKPGSPSVPVAQAWQRAIRADPRNPIFWYQFSSFLYRMGESAEALKMIDESISIYPRGGPGHALRAEILHALGRNQEAQQAQNLARSLDPKIERASWQK